MNVTVDPILYGESHLVLRLRAAAPEAAGGEGGRPLHIGILLDNSGSMGGGRMSSVKRTLHAARPLLRSGDRVTLVTFSDEAAVALREHALTEEAATFEQLYNTIDNIQADSSTNLSAGLEALYGITTNYDAVILLTDGIVNAGITSTAGLRAMAQAASQTMVFHTLGYGADHNRTLLRELSVQSRGTYTYVDSDEILPLAIGDILSGLRAEVAHGVRVALPPGSAWRCCEVGAQGRQDYYVGNMVAGRDYWTVFEKVAGSDGSVLPGPYLVSVAGTGSRTIMPSASDITGDEAHDQIMRTRVVAAMETATNALEAGRGGVSVNLAPLRALQTELEGLPARPLLLRLRAQIAEVLELLQAPNMNLYRSSSPHTILGGGAAAAGVNMNHLMARMSSGTACLSNQRGVYRTLRTRAVAPAEEDEAANVSFFSTPTQRSASHAVYSGATQVSEPSEPYEPVGVRAPTPTVDEEDVDAGTWRRRIPVIPFVPARPEEEEDAATGVREPMEEID